MRRRSAAERRDRNIDGGAPNATNGIADMIGGQTRWIRPRQVEARCGRRRLARREPALVCHESRLNEFVLRAGVDRCRAPERRRVGPHDGGVDVRGAGHLPSPQPPGVGLLGVTEGERHEVRLGLELEHRDMEVGSNVDDQRRLRPADGHTIEARPDPARLWMKNPP
jgi:hypothetical protein